MKAFARESKDPTRTAVILACKGPENKPREGFLLSVVALTQAILQTDYGTAFGGAERPAEDALGGCWMPHLVLRGTVDLTGLGGRLDARVDRWGRAVIKTGDRWCRTDGEAILVDGVVVELSRPLHPVAMVARRDDSTVVRLWPVVEVERTPAVQRWLGVLAAAVQRAGGGPVVTTNIGGDILDGLDLAFDSE